MYTFSVFLRENTKNTDVCVEYFQQKIVIKIRNKVSCKIVTPVAFICNYFSEGLLDYLPSWHGGYLS